MQKFLSSRDSELQKIPWATAVTLSYRIYSELQESLWTTGDPLRCRSSYLQGILWATENTLSYRSYSELQEVLGAARDTLSYRRHSELHELLYCWEFKKNSFMVFPSHKIIVQNTHSHWKPNKPYWGPAGRCETQLKQLNVSYWLSESSPPHVWPSWYAWRAIYLLSTEKQFLRTQCCCHSVLWQTDSHCIIIFIISN